MPFLVTIFCHGIEGKSFTWVVSDTTLVYELLEDFKSRSGFHSDCWKFLYKGKNLAKFPCSTLQSLGVESGAKILATIL